MSGHWFQWFGGWGKESRPGAAGACADDLDEAVEAARREWHTAQQYFGTVTDPDLIDHAAHLVKATERRYMYLLRQARGRLEEALDHAGNE